MNQKISNSELFSLFCRHVILNKAMFTVYRGILGIAIGFYAAYLFESNNLSFMALGYLLAVQIDVRRLLKREEFPKDYSVINIACLGFGILVVTLVASGLNSIWLGYSTIAFGVVVLFHLSFVFQCILFDQH